MTASARRYSCSTIAATAAAKASPTSQACWPTLAQRAWLAEKAGIAPGRIVLMGESLGGAVAVDLATDGRAGVDPGKHVQLGARRGRLSLSVLASSLGDANAVRLGNQNQELSWPSISAPWRLRFIVPLRFAKRLFEAANEPKQFLLVAGADHNDPSPPGYYEKLRAFIEKAGVGKFFTTRPAANASERRPRTSDIPGWHSAPTLPRKCEARTPARLRE